MSSRPARAVSSFLRDLKEVVLPTTPGAAEELFLDRLTVSALERELEAAGVFGQLAARGYGGFSLQTSRVEREHRVLLQAAGVDAPLMDLRVSEVTCVPREAILREHGVEVLYLLAVHWLMLQDPRAAFTRERPRLPGQMHPGLGIGRRVFSRLMAWAYDWGKDALINYPAYYHNAVFYSRLFAFLSPRRQGRLEALRRDLAGMSVAEASRAVDEGRVVEEPRGVALRWRASEMVAPQTRPLKTFLKSEAYCAAAAEAKDGVRYRLAGATT